MWFLLDILVNIYTTQLLATKYQDVALFFTISCSTINDCYILSFAIFFLFKYLLYKIRPYIPNLDYFCSYLFFQH